MIVQRRLTHYRVPLFERLRSRLAEREIDLHLVVGDPSPSELEKEDGGEIAWAHHAPCTYWMDGKLCWQPFGTAAAGAELVVVTQEMKLLYNLVPMFTARPYRLAYWGHGRNFQTVRDGTLVERFKRALTTRVDWWFAYTSLTVQLVQAAGFDAARITCLNNAVDTTALRDQLRAVTPQAVDDVRATLRIPPDAPVGLYCGSLYEEKRIPLLLDAAIALRRLCPTFHLIVVGAGPDSDAVRAAAQRHDWIHPTGALRGAARAPYFRAADVFLNPGLVGLAILDAFCAGLPLVTTRNALHSPEIAYLEPGSNGMFAPDSPEGFAAVVAELLHDRPRLAELSRSARAATESYSLDAMVERFADGITRCLNGTDR